MPRTSTQKKRDSEWAKRWTENAKRNEQRKAERREIGSSIITKTYTVRVKKPSSIYDATEKAARKMGIKPGVYLRIALTEKLKRDGFEFEDDCDDTE